MKERFTAKMETGSLKRQLIVNMICFGPKLLDQARVFPGEADMMISFFRGGNKTVVYTN